jgi:hypothetical protein
MPIFYVTPVYETWKPNTEPQKLLDYVTKYKEWIEDAYTKPPESPEDHKCPLLIVNVNGRLMPTDKLYELIGIADSLRMYRVDINVTWRNYRPRYKPNLLP